MSKIFSHLNRTLTLDEEAFRKLDHFKVQCVCDGGDFKKKRWVAGVTVRTEAHRPSPTHNPSSARAHQVKYLIYRLIRQFS